MIEFESTHKRYLDAREEYLRLESLLAVARAKMNEAERNCSVEWRKLLDASSVTSTPREAPHG